MSEIKGTLMSSMAGRSSGIHAWIKQPSMFILTHECTTSWNHRNTLNLLHHNQLVQLTHFDIQSIFNKSYHGCSLVVACSLTYPPLLSPLYSQCKTMLASMTISPTISPFVIDDNNSCSPYEHAPFVFISPPLASMAKGVHLPVSEISDHCWLFPLSICTILGPVCMPGVIILSPLSSFSSLMNSRCVKVFERP